MVVRRHSEGFNIDLSEGHAVIQEPENRTLSSSPGALGVVFRSGRGARRRKPYHDALTVLEPTAPDLERQVAEGGECRIL
jgi:hypothetical protein